MDLRVASIVLLMAALASAYGTGYVVKKVVKAAPQYQPYSVKGQGKRTPPPASSEVWQKCSPLASLLFPSVLTKAAYFQFSLLPTVTFS